MVTIDLKKLIKNVGETENFKLPDMNAGTQYLYDNLYRRMSQGEPVRLSEINFAGFNLDDINNIRNLEFDFFRRAEDIVEKITSSLKSLPPVATAISFI